MFHRILRRFGRILCLAVVAIGGLSLSGCLFIPHGHHHHHDWDGGGWHHGHGYDGGWNHHGHGHYDGW